MCSVWAAWIGRWIPDHGSTAQHRHSMQVRALWTLDYAGSSLRRWGWWERAIASADCLFRQPIFTVAILAREQQNGPFAIRAAEDGRRALPSACLLIAPHRIASHRMTPHGTA